MKNSCAEIINAASTGDTCLSFCGMESRSLSIETVVTEVGDSGRYQKLLFWMFLFPISVLLPWVALTPIFLSAVPAHWCHVPGRPDNVTEEVWKNMTIPWETKEGSEVLSQCHQYNITSDLTLFQNLDSDLYQTDVDNSSKEIIDCQTGWDYDHSEYDSTLSEEWDWVCSKDYLASTWLSVGIAGNVVGTLILNSASDLLGRSSVFVVSCLITAAFGVLRLYMTSFWALMVMNFIASLPFPAILELSLIIVLEQVSPSWRTKITAFSFVFWTVGMSILPLIAWLANDWKTLGVITSAPFAAYGIGWWVLPESPRWLLSRGRLEEAKALLRTMARINKRKAPENLDEKVEILSKEEMKTTNYGAIQLFTYPTVRLRTILLTACYTCNNLFYYGLTYNVGNMSGNVYLNFFLFAITELPSNIMAWWSAQYFGRRWTEACCFLIASAVLLLTLPTLDSSPWINTLVVTVSRVFATMSYMVIYVQCAEIYPTTHRATGTGLSSLISSSIGTAIPYLAYLNVYWEGLPYVVICIVGLVGFTVASLLPETLDANLPQTLKQADTFLTSEPYWSYRGKRPFKKRAA